MAGTTTRDLRFMVCYQAGDCDFRPTLEGAKELADSNHYGECEVWDTTIVDENGDYTEESLVYISAYKRSW